MPSISSVRRPDFKPAGGHTRRLALALGVSVVLLAHASPALAAEPAPSSTPAARHVLWQIGQADHSDAEFALAPKDFARFKDDAFYLVGESDAKRSWPYVQPGPADAWAGARPHTFTILFGVKTAPKGGQCRLELALLDTHSGSPPVLRIQVNQQSFDEALPKGAGDHTIRGESGTGKPHKVTVDFSAHLLQAGNNRIDITTTSGSWILYDAVNLEVPQAVESSPVGDFTVLAAAELSPDPVEREGRKLQSLRASVVHTGPPVDAAFTLDDKPLQTLRLTRGRQTVELRIPATDRTRKAVLALALAGQPTLRREVVLTPGVREIIVVFKTHFDIGYTDLATNIVQKYRTTMIDQALAVADQNRDLPPAQQFVWTLSGWPMHKITEPWNGQRADRERRVEQALKQGRFVVHALPFTTHTELLEAEDLVRGLGFSSRLVRSLGLELPHDAKMTDVPEHTWMMATLLHHAGVTFMHIGCNGMSGAPQVPPLYWWEGPDGSRVLTMYSPDYGTGLFPPANWPHRTWLALLNTGDNHGPPRPEEVKRVLEDVSSKMPGVKVRIGRLSDFGDAILAENADLPVVHADTPDTWIHGPMSDPAGARLARNTRPLITATEALNTHLRAWGVPAPDATPAVVAAYEQSLLYGEHTWGGSIGWIDGRFGFGEDFKKERAAGRFQRIESSWAEHTAYIQAAHDLIAPVLAGNLKALAQSVGVTGPRIVVYNPLPWKRSGLVNVICDATGITALQPADRGPAAPVAARRAAFQFVATELPPMGYRTFIPAKAASLPSPLRADDEAATLESPFFKAALDLPHGTLRSLIDLRTGRELVDVTAPQGFGAYLYERFDRDQVQAYMHAYLKNFSWTLDFDKPGLPSAETAPYRAVSPANFKLRFEQSPVSVTAVMESAGGGGVPHGVTTRLILYRDQPYADLEITLHDKPLESWPEAGWLCLPFKISEPQFRLGRLGSIVDPAHDIVPGANRHLFAINTGVAMFDPQGAGVAFCPLDHPLVSLETPGCWKFSRDFVPKKSFAYLNLFNNQWNTNFRLWNSGTWTSRVRLWAFSHYDADTALITPSLQARYPLLAVAGDGAPGKASNTQSGLRLSRHGVQVTAFGENPDGDGTVVRLWELAGQSGDCRVELPSGLNVSIAQPVDLRGTPLGKPLPIRGHAFTATLRGFAPASFVLCAPKR